MPLGAISEFQRANFWMDREWAIGPLAVGGSLMTRRIEKDDVSDTAAPNDDKAFRNDARAKVTGRAKYSDDIKRHGMVHAAPVYADEVHADLLAIDTAAARAMPGVLAVLTAEDARRIGGRSTFSYLFCDHRMLVGVGDRIRCHGDVIALVVARTRAQAIDAARMVTCQTRPLEPILDVEEALKNPRGFVHEDHRFEGAPSNVVNHYKVRRGAARAELDRCDFVLDQTFRTQLHEHAYLEPESALCVPRPDGVMEVVGSMQHPFSTRRFVAAMLGCPLADVEVRSIPMGGGFGGKDDTAAIVCARAALAARILNRPVRLTYAREWSMRESYKRHPYVLRYRMGVRGDRVHAVEVEIIADAGAYCSSTPWVTWRSTVQCCGPYEVPHVHADVFGVYTNNPFTGAFRGFGSPQVNFAIEQLMDMAAARVGLSPVEFRRRNMVRQGSETITGQKLEGHTVSLDQALDAVTRAIGFDEKFARCSHGVASDGGDELFGVGLAISSRGMSLGAEGADFNSAILNMNFDGSILLETAIHENGQGAESAFILIAARELGCDPTRVRYRQPSTANIPDGGTTVASRGTLMGGGATVIAAQKLRQKLARALCHKLECRPDEVRFFGDRIWGPADARSLTWEEAGEIAYWRQEPPHAFGVFHGPKVSWNESTGQGEAYFTWVYGCQAVALTVNRRTGRVRLLDMVAAHEVGRAVNPPMLRGQIFGGMVQGVGFGLCEAMKCEGGRLKSLNLDTYKLPRAADLPEMKALFIENADSTSPSGAKGIGEPALELMSPAIANAIFHATGVRLCESPATPDKLRRRLIDAADMRTSDETRGRNGESSAAPTDSGKGER